MRREMSKQVIVNGKPMEPCKKGKLDRRLTQAEIDKTLLAGKAAGEELAQKLRGKDV
jgi:hypothetical protein